MGYGGLVKLREALYKKAILQSKGLSCPVISVGNITVGGTGKTPMTVYVAELIKRLGYRVAIVSRGYKGKAEKTGGVVSDGHTILMGPGRAGDEPFMLAKRLKTVPVVVGKNRFKAGMLAIKEFNPDVLLLDDGFQHRKLKRDIDLVLLDSKAPFGNTYLFPRGTLRETASSLKRGDAFVFTRSDMEAPKPIDQKTILPPGKPIFHSYHTPYVYKVVSGENQKGRGRLKISSGNNFEIFKRKSVFAFSGIAHNDNFRRTLESSKCKLTGFVGYPDHYQYSSKELDKILSLAIDQSADFIFTTEKDFVRVAHRIKWPIDLVVIGVEISFGEQDKDFKFFIKSRLQGLIERNPG
jgi:tetraacyldisaccharide 4'-kinase